MEIRIFSTGGTIDDIDLANSSTRRTHIPTALKQARISSELVVTREVLMKKDSRAMTASDREHILSKCRACKEDKILITHGTFTIPETASYLGKTISNKTIVITGSMLPLSEQNTDAMFNLGSAIVAVQFLPFGVYVVIHGLVFHWHNIKKESSKGGYFKRLY